MVYIRAKVSALCFSLALAFVAFDMDSVSAGMLKKPEVQSFIEQMKADERFTEKELKRIFKKARRQDKIIKLMERPAEKRFEWWEYRNLFINDKRINEGVKFWKKNEDALIKAQKKYNVSPNIIIGIIGIETGFGQRRGGYRIIDSLSTLAFYYPRRANFFSRELKEYLLLTKEQGFDPLRLQGSYAGAMGIPQFMPSSYREYAVDMDEDGQADIWNSVEDAIGSVASYLKRHGWKKGEPVAVKASVGGKFNELLAEDPKPKQLMSKAQTLGWHPEKKIDSNEKVRGLQLEAKDGTEYWLTTKNFFVITRYNKSNLYAMAAHQLGDAVYEKFKKQ